MFFCNQIASKMTSSSVLIGRISISFFGIFQLWASKMTISSKIIEIKSHWAFHIFKYFNYEWVNDHLTTVNWSNKQIDNILRKWTLQKVWKPVFAPVIWGHLPIIDRFLMWFLMTCFKRICITIALVF